MTCKKLKETDALLNSMSIKMMMMICHCQHFSFPSDDENCQDVVGDAENDDGNFVVDDLCIVISISVVIISTKIAAAEIVG